MKNTYVTNHNWGSFESCASINKLILRNEEDFNEYLNMILPIAFDANTQENVMKFQNGSKFKVLTTSLVDEN